MKIRQLLLSLALLSPGSIIAQQTSGVLLNIHPTPRQVMKTDSAFAMPNSISIQPNKDVDLYALDALKDSFLENKKGVKLFIGEYDDKAMKRFAVDLPKVSGGYYLQTEPDRIVVIGYDGRGTYYGVQTLKQLLQNGKMERVEIRDYPEIRFRGSVEGFYGTPWSHRDRLAQLKFYGENKLNTYIYGPKDDPYHSSLSNHADNKNPNPNASWRDPYPEQEGKNISELASTAKKYKVDFVWAIHPGQDIKWNEEDYAILLNKFEHMYDLGVRSFAVFFDDISGEGTNAHKQAALLNRLNKEFVQVKGDVTPLIMCPTEYNRSWANPKEDGYLSILGRELDPSVEIMWTGDRVCADITMETLNWINPKIKRPAYIWWNFPVTDYIRDKVLQGPSCGLDKAANKTNMAGFVSNPMENAEASKIALYGVAQYTWNPSEYDYLATWEKAIKTLAPTDPKAYRTFAIHSADLERNGHGYRKDESWETNIFDPKNYTQSELVNLKDEFKNIKNAPAKMFNAGMDPYLLEELKPWLEQFEILGHMGIDAIDLLEISKHCTEDEIWNAILNTELTPGQEKAFNTHKSGTLKLRPFINDARGFVLESFYERISGNPIKKISPISSFANNETLGLMLDNDDNTHYYTWQAQKAGDWVGVDMKQDVPINSIVIKQGRKDGDRDYFQRAVVEYSLDSVVWHSLTEVSDSTYTIKYSGNPIIGRYVRLRATEGVSDKNWTAIREFAINPCLKAPVTHTNNNRFADAKISKVGDIIKFEPILEVINIAPQEYFGIELPVVSAVENTNIDLGTKSGTIQYSNDGNTYTDIKPASTKFIRFINNGKKDISLKLNKFEIELAAGSHGEITMAMDKDLKTGFMLNGATRIVVPRGVSQVVVLSRGGSNANVTLFDKQGKEIAKNELGGDFSRIDLLPTTENILLEGECELKEVIFK